MRLDRAEAIVKELLAPKYLNPPQEMVFRAAWKGQSYRDLADAAGYDCDYLKGVGAQVWRMLATATESRVTKGNFRQVLELFASKLDPPKSIGLETTQPQINWGEALDLSAFYGRELERSQLDRWIVTDRCRLVAILGMGGMGKTTMAIDLVQKLQAANQGSINEDPHRFSYILWRSLLNAPLLKELLPELIRTLLTSPGLTLDRNVGSAVELMPTTVASQIELLLEICQQYRCLIVLDNGESIFPSWGAGGTISIGIC
jgi:hypothetical protein